MLENFIERIMNENETEDLLVAVGIGVLSGSLYLMFRKRMRK